MTTLAVAEAPPPQFQVITLTGRLTRDPELRELPNGGSVCKLRLAVDDMARGTRDRLHQRLDVRQARRSRRRDPLDRLAGRRRRPPRIPRVGAGRQDPPRLRGDRQRRVPRLAAPHRRGRARAARRGSHLNRPRAGRPIAGVPPTSLPTRSTVMSSQQTHAPASSLPRARHRPDHARDSSTATGATTKARRRQSSKPARSSRCSSAPNTAITAARGARRSPAASASSNCEPNDEQATPATLTATCTCSPAPTPPDA